MLRSKQLITFPSANARLKHYFGGVNFDSLNPLKIALKVVIIHMSDLKVDFLLNRLREQFDFLSISILVEAGEVNSFYRSKTANCEPLLKILNALSRALTIKETYPLILGPGYAL